MNAASVRRLTTARIPTVDGPFSLMLYENDLDDKDHLAVVYGDVEGAEDVLVRIHSECFTGDVLGSLRCDCGEQLNTSMRMIAEAGQGVILYLRQEGRGIGLHDKLRAYNLQDEGYDTVEANLMLGHEPDERDYTVGALMIQDLDIESVRLITNNPAKIESLREYDVDVTERVPIEPHLNRHNSSYLETKVERMRHMLQMDAHPPSGDGYANPHSADLQSLRQQARHYAEAHQQAFITLSYAQSLNGAIAGAACEPVRISDAASMDLTHKVRSVHDGILVGIGTVLSDDPRLTVRRVPGRDPRPIILDTNLRCPADAQLLQADPKPLIYTTSSDEGRIQALENAGAVVKSVSPGPGGVSLQAVRRDAWEQGIASIMIEGGATVIRYVLQGQHAQKLIVTLAPMYLAGIGPFDRRTNGSTGSASALGQSLHAANLTNVTYQWAGEDIVLFADPVWEDA
ncbi:MAG: GTP cyclohydrolase II [Longimonas sp.]|uniref:GTP cyclohydrolase II n=1 Tax=Longimonas sp. TaxID=2039626 RepID=UPI00335C91C7